MPRSNRYFTAGRTFHITHRCHDRNYLLRFAKDRNAYQEMLRQKLGEYPVSLFNYCLTSNHVHLLLHTDTMDAVSALMKSLAGEFGQAYNRRKQRSGAYWGDRYHSTLIDGGQYLWRCLLYIDLNMVRAGVVLHPQEWKWCGHHELMGRKNRYRLIDLDGLMESLGCGSLEEFKARYTNDLNCRLDEGRLDREAYWTDSLAVGSDPFLQAVSKTLKNRKRILYESADHDSTIRLLKESNEVPYGAEKVNQAQVS